MPFYNRHRAVFRTVSDATLNALHRKLREQNFEAKIWDAIFLSQLGHPLPDAIAFDLIERNISIDFLAHSPQSEAVLWRLTPLADEAILTLAKWFYVDNRRSLDEFKGVLRRFPDHRWMLHSLAHCAASSVEKRRAFERAIEKFPDCENWLLINTEIDAQRKYEIVFNDGDFLVRRDEILYGGFESAELLEIARSDETPDEILRDLEELRGFPHGKEVRFAARCNLRRRAPNS